MEGRKQAPWRQSTKGAAEPGEDERVRGGAGGETPGGSLPLTYPRGETPGGGTPGGSTPGGGSLLLTAPQKVPMGQCGVAPTPLTKTVRFRLVWGTHFLFHLSD